MFRRRWSGLPDDPEFPADLEKLGYHINEADEIRSNTDPKFYFNFFLTKNSRHNERQRFAFNLAVQDVIHARLATRHQLVKIPFPPISALSPTAAAEHEIPKQTSVFVSRDFRAACRVVVIVGEPEQELGVLAHRVIGGAGGIDEGSMVSIVKALQEQEQQKENYVGVVLANTGETWWWPEGCRALCYRQSQGVSMRSAAMRGRWFDARRDGIPGSADAEEHVRCVFESLLLGGGGERESSTSTSVSSALGLGLAEDAVVEVIGLADGAIAVERYLDANWDRWGGRIGCLALVGGGEGVDELKDEGFKKFLREKARAYITTTAPLGTPMANPGGNPHTVYFTTYGCPVFSAGEPYYTELALVKSKGLVLPWMEEVYRASGAYVNPALDVTFRDASFTDEPAWSGKPWVVPEEGGGSDGTSSGSSSGPQHPRAARVQDMDADEGGVEIISRDEWERRQEEAEDKGEEADLSKVVVL